MWETKSWLLHHGNGPAHNALSMQKFFAKNKIAVREQLPYSPDLDPCDFCLFSKIKGVIKETHFQNSTAIITAVMKELFRSGESMAAENEKVHPSPRTLLQRR